VNFSKVWKAPSLADFHVPERSHPIDVTPAVGIPHFGPGTADDLDEVLAARGGERMQEGGHWHVTLRRSGCER